MPHQHTQTMAGYTQVCPTNTLRPWRATLKSAPPTHSDHGGLHSSLPHQHTQTMAGYTQVCPTNTLRPWRATLTLAWTQCTVPGLSHTMSPGCWVNRYTGMLRAFSSSRMGHQDPVRKHSLCLRRGAHGDVVKACVHLRELTCHRVCGRPPSTCCALRTTHTLLGQC